MPPKRDPARRVGGTRQPAARRGRGTTGGGSGRATGTGQIPGRPATRPGRINIINLVRTRLSPQVTDARLIETYLDHNGWNQDAAYNEYLVDRQAIQNNPQQVPGANVPAPAPTPQTLPSATQDDGQTAEQEIDGKQATEQEDDKVKETNEEKAERHKRWMALNALRNDNIEQERRDAALALRKGIQEAKGVKLSRVQAVLLLQLAGWDIGVAFEEFKNLKDALCRLHVHFDDTRSKLIQTIIRKRSPDQYQQDRRLALLVTITARPDWWSCYVFLRDRAYDLPKAVYDWYTVGIPPVAHPDDASGLGRRVDHNLEVIDAPSVVNTQPPTNPDPDWEPEPDVFAQQHDCKEYDVESLEDVEWSRAQASLINERRGPIKVGEENRSLFLLEYIKYQMYRRTRFNSAVFQWPELEGKTNVTDDEDLEGSDNTSLDPQSGDSGSPEPSRGKKRKTGKTPSMNDDGLSEDRPVIFDFGNRAHIKRLNNIRRQNMFRITGKKLRKGAQEWSNAELGFLWWLHMENLCRQMAANPGKTEQEVLDMKLPRGLLREWTERLNAKFEGTTQKGSKKPRFKRKATAVNTQRARTPQIFKRFQLTKDKSKFWSSDEEGDEKKPSGKKGKGKKRKRDEEDADDEAEE